MLSDSQKLWAFVCGSFAALVSEGMKSITFWLGCGLLMLAVLNCWSSVAVARDPGVTKKQRVLQISLIWLLPVLGAATILSVRHFASRQQDRSRGDSSLAVDDRHYIGKGYF